MSDPVTRRDFLAASGALAAAWLSADHRALQASLHHAAKAAGGSPPPWIVFTNEQGADVEAIVAQIIPADDLPGAREARVANFIDHSLATWAADQKEAIVAGLYEFTKEIAQRGGAAKRFAALAPDEQIAFLKAHEQVPFFQQLRFATIVGMFSLPSYGGNHEKAGWRILGFEDRFTWQPPFGDYDAEAGG